jgi:ribonuclease D
MFAASISKEELQLLPAGQFRGHIHLVENAVQMAQACAELKDIPVLGFDTETKPTFTKGHSNRVSLLQLATRDNAYLFRLNRIGLPIELVRILANPLQLKVGVAIRDDIRHLSLLHPFKPNGFIELQDFVRNFGIENSGLSKLSGIVLNFRVSKSQQLSNWENPVLTDAQQLYAATDAWAASEIYKKLLLPSNQTP